MVKYALLSLALAPLAAMALAALAGAGIMVYRMGSEYWLSGNFHWFLALIWASISFTLVLGYGLSRGANE